MDRPEIRLQKFLSQAGVASRRGAEDLIRAGRVRLNGRVVTELGTKLAPGRDVVELDGRRVRAAAPVWIAFHKPRGLVSTRRDPQGRRTIYDALPARFRTLFYVGRLDAESEGLMLLTNDGDGAHRLLHPRFGTLRVYDVELDGAPSAEDLLALQRGVPLEDGPARAEFAERSDAAGAAHTLRLGLREGRKREVRRMLAALGHTVRRLERVRYGPVELGGLEPGAWRRLTRAELRALRRGTEEGGAGGETADG